MASGTIRAESERLQALAQDNSAISNYLDQYIAFLTTVHNLFPPPPPREPIDYPNARL